VCEEEALPSDGIKAMYALLPAYLADTWWFPWLAGAALGSVLCNILLMFGVHKVVNTRGRETEHAAMDQLEGSMHEPSQGLAYDTPMESLDDLVMVTEGGLDNWDYGNRHSPLSPAHGGAPELMMELKPLDLDLATGSTPDSISGLEDIDSMIDQLDLGLHDIAFTDRRLQ